jgi:hypothetical protein
VLSSSEASSGCRRSILFRRVDSSYVSHNSRVFASNDSIEEISCVVERSGRLSLVSRSSDAVGVRSTQAVEPGEPAHSKSRSSGFALGLMIIFMYSQSGAQQVRLCLRGSAVMEDGGWAIWNRMSCRKATGEGRKSGETMDAGLFRLAGRVHDI